MIDILYNNIDIIYKIMLIPCFVLMYIFYNKRGHKGFQMLLKWIKLELSLLALAFTIFVFHGSCYGITIEKVTLIMILTIILFFLYESNKFKIEKGDLKDE